MSCCLTELFVFISHLFEAGIAIVIVIAIFSFKLREIYNTFLQMAILFSDGLSICHKHCFDNISVWFHFI